MKFEALVRDTLLEIRASSILYLYAIVTLGVLAVEWFMLGQSSSMHIAINGQRMTASGGEQMAKMLLPNLAVFVAKAVALFTLFGMSDVMTPVLTKGTAEVYLSKPVPRWLLMLARYTGHAVAAGAALVVTLALIFVVAGARVGVWDARLFAALAPAMLNVCVYLSMLTLANIFTGSSGLSGLLGFGVLLLSSTLRFHDVLGQLFDNVLWRQGVHVLYVILPKPYEIEDGISVLMTGKGAVPWFAIVTSAAFGVACVLGAMAAFRKRDY